MNDKYRRCEGYDCPLRNECVRHIASKNKYAHYFTECHHDGTSCLYFYRKARSKPREGKKTMRSFKD